MGKVVKTFVSTLKSSTSSSSAAAAAAGAARAVGTFYWHEKE